MTSQDDKEHLAFIIGDVAHQPEVLVRVHSECFTGDVLGSLRCDCGVQLTQSLQLIAQEGTGVLIYLRQEGRGIGLLNKLHAYNLQDQGHDTVDANLLLGHGADERDYTIAALVLKDLGVPSVRLLTNNPLKIESLRALGIPVTTRVPLPPRVTLVGGLRAVPQLGPSSPVRLPRLQNLHYQQLEDDMVLWGDPVWERG